MNGMLIIGLTVVFSIGTAIVVMLLSIAKEERAAVLQPFAMLLVTESTPTQRALLEHYASQIAWIDADVLRCVLLVYPPDAPEIGALCRDLARDHEFYTAMPLPEVQQMLIERCQVSTTFQK